MYAAAGSGCAELLVMSRNLVTYIADEFYSVYEEMYNVAEIKMRNYEASKLEIEQLIEQVKGTISRRPSLTKSTSSFSLLARSNTHESGTPKKV
jgi:hypothetical protein